MTGTLDNASAASSALMRYLLVALALLFAEPAYAASVFSPCTQSGPTSAEIECLGCFMGVQQMTSRMWT